MPLGLFKVHAENCINRSAERLLLQQTETLITCTAWQMESRSCCWDIWVEEAVAKLQSHKLLRSLRTIIPKPTNHCFSNQAADYLEVFDEMHPRDRLSVEVDIAETTIRDWLLDIPSSGEGTISVDGVKRTDQDLKRLILFSANDYLGLSVHPAVGKAAAKAALEHGMGPRASAIGCGYTNYHSRLESSLAELKKQEDCLLCPTGFAANMALMTAIGSISLLLAASSEPLEEERVAIFSDALNHASIIDGIRLAQKQRSIKVFVYRHCDMSHLDELLSSCSMKKKVVVTDSLFSMDGDFAPMLDLARLRKKHGFLFVLDDAHMTFVCGENGGGVAEAFNCEGDVDICIGTLSKGGGCQGGFIACSKIWKHLILSRGRAFVFSTAPPVPLAAAAHAAVVVARKETWRRKELWKRVKDFQALTGIPITSPIISLIVGTEEKALEASRHMLKSGFHVPPVRPPIVPPNSCRLRVTLSAVHSADDVKKLTDALSRCINFRDVIIHGSKGHARM